MYTAAVCDDNPVFLAELCSVLKRGFAAINICCDILPYSDGESLTAAYAQGRRFDFVFLDIDMPKTNGMEVAQELRSYDSQFKLVYVSSYEDEVFNVFEYKPSGFIPKRLLNEKVGPLLMRLVDEMQTDTNRRAIDVYEDKHIKSTVVINTADILFFESVNNIVYLHMAGREPLCLGRITLESIEREYIPLGFFRLNRALVVKMSFIKRVYHDAVELEDGQKLYFSRRRKKEFDKAFVEYAEKLYNGSNLSG